MMKITKGLDFCKSFEVILRKWLWIVQIDIRFCARVSKVGPDIDDRYYCRLL